MDSKENDYIAAFDAYFTTGNIQMLKILLSRAAPASRSSFAVWIKLLELQHTMRLSRTHPTDVPGCGKTLSLHLTENDTADTIELLDELLPFSDEKERAKIQSFKNMLQQMGHMKEMMEMMQMMQEMFPDAFQGGGAQNPADLFSGLSGGMENSDFSSILQMLNNGLQ